MYWTLELAHHLEDAPWPATRDELIDYAIRSGAPLEVIENLQQMEDEGEVYEGMEEIWPDYPRKDDFLFNEDEYWGPQSSVGLAPALSREQTPDTEKVLSILIIFKTFFILERYAYNLSPHTFLNYFTA